MRRLECFLNFTVGIMFFNLAVFAYEGNKTESGEKSKSKITDQYHYLDEDQDLLMAPSIFDLLAKGESLHNEAEAADNKAYAHKEVYDSNVRINIFQSIGSPSVDGWNVDDSLLFFDTQNTHLEKDTPKEVEAGYLNTLLMASVMDELHL